MNCLLYARISRSEQTQQIPSDIIATRLAPPRNYAKEHGWNVVDQVIDVDESVKCANNAKLKNLRRSLAKHSNVDMVIVSTTDILSFADFAALKTVLDQKGMQLTILLSPRYSNPGQHPS